MQNNENALRAISLVLDNTTAFGMALSLALIPLCLTYFAHRARSVLFLRDRLWRFIGGKSEFYAEEFDAIRKESRDLEHFRMEFRVPTESTTDAKNFLQWQKQSQISIRKISLAHEYID